MTLQESTVRRGGLSAQVYETLKERLLDGEHAAGDALSVEEIRLEFGVSKQPVMEAMRLLSADGLVEIFPQIGISVARYSMQEMRDFYRMFSRFEGAICETAVERATPLAVSQLKVFAQTMHSLEESDDPRERANGYRRGNREFHRMIHEMADSPLMASMGRRLFDLSDFLISTTTGRLVMAPALPDRNHDHDEIVEAFVARKPKRARDLMEAHILGTVAIIDQR